MYNILNKQMRTSLTILLTLLAALTAQEASQSISSAFAADGYLFLRGVKASSNVLRYRMGTTESFLNTKHTLNYRLNIYPSPVLSNSTTNGYLGWIEGSWEMEGKTVVEFKNFAKVDQPVFVIYEKMSSGKVEAVGVPDKYCGKWAETIISTVNGLFPTINNPKDYFLRGDVNKGTTIENIRGIPLNHDRILSEKIELNL